MEFGRNAITINIDDTMIRGSVAMIPSRMARRWRYSASFAIGVDSFSSKKVVSLLNIFSPLVHSCY